MRWQKIEKEIQLMKNLKETNASTTTQKSENNANANKMNDGKTSPNEVLSELTKVRSWITKTIEYKFNYLLVGNTERFQENVFVGF